MRCRRHHTHPPAFRIHIRCSGCRCAVRPSRSGDGGMHLSGLGAGASPCGLMARLKARPQTKPPSFPHLFALRKTPPSVRLCGRAGGGSPTRPSSVLISGSTIRRRAPMRHPTNESPHPDRENSSARAEICTPTPRVRASSKPALRKAWPRGGVDPVIGSCGASRLFFMCRHSLIGAICGVEDMMGWRCLYRRRGMGGGAGQGTREGPGRGFGMNGGRDWTVHNIAMI